MKYITLAAAAVLTGAAAFGTTAVMAQASFGIPTTPRHPPRTNFTGGFPFGFVSPAPHHQGRGHHRHRRAHRDFGIGYLGYGGDDDGYADTIPMSEEPGYFSTGGSVTFDGVRPVYDYDRSYPYEHYRGVTGPSGLAVAAQIRCQVQNVRDEGSGRQVPIRVCRRD